MKQQHNKLTAEQIVNNLGDIRAPFIAAEIQGDAFKPARHPLYLEYAMELLRQLLPVAALEKAYVGTTLDHTHDMQDHLVCNRAVNLMCSMVDKALFERFKAEHPKMPKQLTAREWPTYMMQMRFNDWHSGVPVYPSAASGLDSATPLDFISEEQSAMAQASRLDVSVLDRDPFDVAVEFSGNGDFTPVTSTLSYGEAMSLASGLNILRGTGLIALKLAQVEEVIRCADQLKAARHTAQNCTNTSRAATN
ncbi:hypothetical protein [Pseudomonas violetae]|uniref:Uncharacterized protein n=1 Tax=Pseudomonas violetae TaxID=2915813 RepID=A0ABT0ETF1_9PSED|nr:hypothetical protein [Pseudomonas violetae]MCK1789007.1 hypothetical protein [Pseudomonas violetae]